jgi:carbamoyl-phosphate synthase small subunit
MSQRYNKTAPGRMQEPSGKGASMTRTKRKGAGFLLLEDGARFPGDQLVGAESCLGEAVFNTSHSGYQEILTDPSYSRQIMVFTAPHIGNVGVNEEDYESGKVQAAAAVMRALSPCASNWRSELSLAQWLEANQIPLLSGVDTRAVTLHLREAGAMGAGIFPQDYDESEALRVVGDSPSMAGANLALGVTCAEPYDFGPEEVRGSFRGRQSEGEGLRVALLDLGVKRAILEELARRGCQVRVFPASAPAEELLDSAFQGILLSNGPGDPAATTGPGETVKILLQEAIKGGRPLMGICLGHQLLCQAAGMETYKLPFGHRGANHPVRREADGQVEITSQNHGFAVRPEGLPAGFEVTHINLNDQTVEGLAHREAPVFSIQYHPEASPGPLEGINYFDAFVENMKR